MVKFKNVNISKGMFNSLADANDYILNNRYNFNFINTKYNYTIRYSFDKTHIIVFNLDTNKITKKLYLIEC